MPKFQQGECLRDHAVLQDLLAEAEASADVFHGFLARIGLAHTLLMVGQYGEARVFAREAVEAASGLGPFLEPWAVAPLAQAALAAGDVAAATEANDAVWQKMMAAPGTGHRQRRTDGGAGIRPRRSRRGQAVGGRCGLRDDRLAPGEGPDDTRPRSDRPGRSGSGEMRCARSAYGCSRYPGLSGRP